MASFNSRMRKRGKQVVANSNRNKKLIAGAVNQAVILSTPVDRGQARANWRGSLGFPLSGSTEAVDPTGGGTIARNASIFSGAVTEQPIYITNNVRHIGPLNDGWSAQAPAGFVELAISAGEAAARRMRLFK